MPNPKLPSNTPPQILLSLLHQLYQYSSHTPSPTRFPAQLSALTPPPPSTPQPCPKSLLTQLDSPSYLPPYRRTDPGSHLQESDCTMGHLEMRQMCRICYGTARRACRWAVQGVHSYMDDLLQRRYSRMMPARL
jgi:hypothetical protein